jgi:TetR/AcrR family transcriptional regulator
MAGIEKETDERIYEAARDVFHERGFDGARMQDIADRAGINKALLHYYYRSKDLLFEKVYQAAAKKLFPNIMVSLRSDDPLPDKVRLFVSGYIDTLRDNPYMPGFILHELNRNPDRIRTFLPKIIEQLIGPFLKEIEAEINTGRLPYKDARHFIVSMFSLCVFPFMARPMLQTVLGFDDDGFNQFLIERKDEIPKLLLRGYIEVRNEQEGVKDV